MYMDRGRERGGEKMGGERGVQCTWTEGERGGEKMGGRGGYNVHGQREREGGRENGGGGEGGTMYMDRGREGGRENGRERGVQCTCIKKELSPRGHLVHVYMYLCGLLCTCTMYLWPAAHTG